MDGIIVANLPDRSLESDTNFPDCMQSNWSLVPTNLGKVFFFFFFIVSGRGIRDTGRVREIKQQRANNTLEEQSMRNKVLRTIFRYICIFN